MSLARIDETTTAALDRGRWELIASQAEMMAKTTIVPKEFQGNPANLMAAGLMGQRYGWDIITAANNIEVVSGKPQLIIHALNALIRSAGHQLNGEATNEQATITGTRGDTGESMTVTFTLADGQRAGVAGNWGKYPADHLWAKALRRLAKRLFADVALNLANDNDDEPERQPAPTSIEAAIDRVLPPAERGGHSPRAITPAPQATNIPTGPAPGAKPRDEMPATSEDRDDILYSDHTPTVADEPLPGITDGGDIGPRDPNYWPKRLKIGTPEVRDLGIRTWRQVVDCRDDVIEKLLALAAEQAAQ